MRRASLNFLEFGMEPVHDRGLAGVVMFDYDGDRDQDIFVTNGPGRPNSLYQNRLGKHGRLSFVDVAQKAGVGLTALDANGACAGDLDNDGHVDLYVLGRSAPNHLLKNRGDGTFADITAASGTGAGALGHASCTMADFDGDGLLDLAVANTFDQKVALPIVAVPYDLNQANQLFRNRGGDRFTDVSVSSGFTTINIGGAPTSARADVSWAIAAVDYDQDGDLDIITANDQGAIPLKKNKGVDRGYVRIHNNNGRGTFRDVTYQAGVAEPGAWMGLSFGDYNFDGTLDLFATNFGDYLMRGLPSPPFPKAILGDYSSRWFLQRNNGTFVDPRRSTLREPSKEGADPGLGGLGATPFGWGTSSFDYDNDGDADIAFHGSLDAMTAVDADNPGALLSNKGPRAVRKGLFPTFTFDDAFTKSGADHRRRTVTGVAVGDLDNNGFADVVSVAQSHKAGNLTRYADDAPFDYGSPFDAGASFLRVYQRVGPPPSLTYRPTGQTSQEGNLAVEINGGNGNRSAAVRTLGSIGITSRGRVNRDGVGAVVKFTPAGGPTAIRPVIAGSSFLSQDSLEGTFGMGRARVGTVDVLWPGGVRNKLFHVRAGERITFPEIPCSYSDTSLSRKRYTGCVLQALHGLVKAHKLTTPQAGRFLVSAIKAYNEAR